MTMNFMDDQKEMLHCFEKLNLANPTQTRKQYQ